MRVILIDPFLQLFAETEIKGELSDYYRLIDCDCFTVAADLPNGDAIYVDDEGLLKGPTAFFGVNLPDYEDPFAGCGIVVGTNSEGESVDAKTTLLELADLIAFGPFALTKRTV